MCVLVYMCVYVCVNVCVCVTSVSVCTCVSSNLDAEEIMGSLCTQVFGCRGNHGWLVYPGIWMRRKSWVACVPGIWMQRKVWMPCVPRHLDAEEIMGGLCTQVFGCRGNDVWLVYAGIWMQRKSWMPCVPRHLDAEEIMCGLCTYLFGCRGNQGCHQL